MTNEAQEFLPPHLLAVGFRADRELAWPRAEAIEAIEWFARQGYAVEGIEVWLPSRSGPEIPSPFIYAWQAQPRIGGESWPDFVKRVKEQAISYVHSFRWDESDLVYQSREPFFNLDTVEESSL
jgi:hypothetical protein